MHAFNFYFFLHCCSKGVKKSASNTTRSAANSTKDTLKKKAAPTSNEKKMKEIEVEKTQSISNKSSKGRQKKSSKENDKKESPLPLKHVEQLPGLLDVAPASTDLQTGQNDNKDVKELVLEKTQQDELNELNKNVPLQQQVPNDPPKFPLPDVPVVPSNEPTENPPQQPLEAPAPSKPPSIEAEAVARFCCQKIHIKTGAFIVAIIQTFIFIFGVTFHLFAYSTIVNSSFYPYVSYLALVYYALQAIPLAMLWIGIRSTRFSVKWRRHFLVPYIIWSIFFIAICYVWVVLGILERGESNVFRKKNQTNPTVKYLEENLKPFIAELHQKYYNPHDKYNNDEFYPAKSVSYDMYEDVLLRIVMFYYGFLPLLQIWCTFTIYYCYSYFARLVEVSNPIYQKSDLHISAAYRYRFCFGLVHIKNAAIAFGLLHFVLIINSILITIGMADLDFTIAKIGVILVTAFFLISLALLFIGLCTQMSAFLLFYFVCGFPEILAWLLIMIFDTVGIGRDLKNNRHAEPYVTWSNKIIIFSVIIQFRVWSNYIAFKCQEYFGNMTSKNDDEKV